MNLWKSTNKRIKEILEMKKMNVQYNKLGYIVENIKGIISDLGEKIGNIHDNAWNEDRDITDREKERCDEIEEQISDLENCVEYIESAMGCLDEYID